MRILAIETSCDETSAAVVGGKGELLSNIVSSQIDLHSKYGGVVPEVACRKHLEVLNPVIQEALDKANCAYEEITAVACANRPGLIGAVLMGVGAAKTISAVLGIPLISVDHLESHIYANFILEAKIGVPRGVPLGAQRRVQYPAQAGEQRTLSLSKVSAEGCSGAKPLRNERAIESEFIEHKDIKFPAVVLIVSGGHTHLIYMKNHLKYEVMGKTRDDAAGEAFDKVGKVLELGYPGGPQIDKLAKEGNETAIRFPKAKLTSPYEFSFSGLKTSVVNFLHKGGLKEHPIEDICASFQKAVVDVLVENTFKAALDKKVKQILLSGGVVANSSLREKMKYKAGEYGFKINFPSIKYCTDNAAMTGICGYYKYKKKIFAKLDLDAYSMTGL